MGFLEPQVSMDHRVIKPGGDKVIVVGKARMRWHRENEISFSSPRVRGEVDLQAERRKSGEGALPRF